MYKIKFLIDKDIWNSILLNLDIRNDVIKGVELSKNPMNIVIGTGNLTTLNNQVII